jgi:hypothetical protein
MGGQRRQTKYGKTGRKSDDIIVSGTGSTITVFHTDMDDSPGFP